MRIILFCLLNVVTIPSTVVAEVRIDGDRALVDVLRSAQQTNLAAHERGRLKATVQTQFTARSEKHSFDVLMMWEGDRAFWKYDSKIEKQGQSHEQMGLRQLEAPSVRICYLPAENRVISWPTKINSIPDGLLIRPRECWYHFGEGRTWYAMFDPEFAAASVESVSVERHGTDEILFQRHYKAGILLKVICSLKFGANVVHYETTPATRLPDAPDNIGRIPNPIHQGDYSWVEDGRFGYRLGKLEQTEADASNPKHPNWKRTITVLECDSEYLPTAGQFTFDALDVKPGTVVDEYSPAHRKYLHGVRPTASVQTELDALLHKLPERGFASSKRGP